MNRPVLSCDHLQQRGIIPDSPGYKEQVHAWTQRLLSAEPGLVPAGHVFQWSTASGTAYLFDAIMCNVQYAQTQLRKSASSAGKAAYKAALDAARTYAFVLEDLLPKWTFRPEEQLRGAQPADIYGHYCLARAMAYNAVGKADLECTDAARQAAAANAAHLYVMAAQLIGDKTASMLRQAQANVADALVLHGDGLLAKWDLDQDSEGACKALACYQEAHQRYMDADMVGCQDKVDYAYERNQVHWMEPKLPEFSSLIRARISSLVAHPVAAGALRE